MTLWYAPLLALGVIGFYLYDSSMLLYANEVVFCYEKGRWRIVQPLPIELSRRRLCVPNPLAPYRPLFRLTWKVGEPQAGPDEQLTAFLSTLRGVQIGVSILSLILAVGIPLILLARHSANVLLIWMTTAYIGMLVILATVYLHQRPLRLTKTDLKKLAFEALTCVPMGLNMVRKISQLYSQGTRTIPFAAAELDAESKLMLLNDIEVNLDSSLEQGEPDFSRQNELLAYRHYVRSQLG